MLRCASTRFSIAGSVQKHRRHLILLESKLSAEAWPKRIEQSQHILADYHKVIEPFNSKEFAKLVVSVAHPGATNTPHEKPTHEALVFPENIRLSDIAPAEVPFVANALLEEKVDIESLKQIVTVTPLSGNHVFVCAHANRDFRCACAGPKLIEWMESDTPDWNVYACSHFGGHRYAGNCIVQPDGEWYGHVNSREALQQIHKAIKDKKPIVPDLWRGRIGLSKDDQLEAYNNEISSCEQ
ncbi:hypothetical protein THRCLA_06341 [Thraustotheca clavata]|uniref:Uncharacterized protein n=1 Tax=Thraustotheca clavata TaxID=74557 RepID=A0A1V9ZPL1_9STRA|nr:hypothetical protein THRCLA_06341 [Thraustotheca clavata]